MKISKPLGCLTSVVLGFFLMIPLAMIFDAMDWPLFHGWGLAHGSFIIAWPLLTWISYKTMQFALPDDASRR